MEFFFYLCQLLDPESYHSLPHEIVVNLAAFFELCDALILLWVQSPHGMVSDATVFEVRQCTCFYFKQEDLPWHKDS
jgi:hypothetical protein